MGTPLARLIAPVLALHILALNIPRSVTAATHFPQLLRHRATWRALLPDRPRSVEDQMLCLSVPTLPLWLRMLWRRLGPIKGVIVTTFPRAFSLRRQQHLRPCLSKNASTSAMGETTSSLGLRMGMNAIVPTLCGLMEQHMVLPANPGAPSPAQATQHKLAAATMC